MMMLSICEETYNRLPHLSMLLSACICPSPGMALVLAIPYYIPKLNKHLEMLLSDRDSSPLYRHSTMTETDRN